MNSSQKNTGSHYEKLDYTDQLNRYYSNNMSTAEKNAFEKRALEDPFLMDAMEGFDAHPGSFEKFYERNRSKLTRRKNYTLVIAIAALIGLFAITTLLDSEQATENNITVNHDLDTSKTTPINLEEISNEYEVLSPEIETLVFIPEKELISVKQVLENQTHEEKPEDPENDLIEIPDLVIPENDYSFEDEDIHVDGQNSTETIYLYDLLVVDYRQINRENEKISYKRYDLSGLPANQEGTEEDPSKLIETEVQIPYHNYLSKSMSYFSASRFKQALNRYLLILEQYPEDINALFYGGLSYYNLGKYEKSVEFFDQILTSELTTFKEEALWYKAKSYVKLGKKTAAKGILNEIISQGGFYTKDAIELKKDFN